MFSIYSLFSATVLVLNALAILSETRLLSKIGLATLPPPPSAAKPSSSGREDSFVPFPFDTEALNQTNPPPPQSRLKQQVAQLLSSVRTLLRWPLILINIVLIVLAFLLN